MGFFQLRARRPDTCSELETGPPHMSDELRAFLREVNEVENESDPRYQRAVDGLRTRPEEVVREISGLEVACPADDFGLRRCLIMAVAAVGHEAAVIPLRDIALRQMPALINSQAMTETSSIVKDTALRTLAVESLERLAREAVAGALAALADAASADSLAVRAIALTALRDAEDAAPLLERALARLPEADRYLAEFRRLDVREVGQISDARRHLVGSEHSVLVPPRLPEDGGPGRDLVEPSSLTPQVRDTEESNG
jgi:hypothetical protein